MLIVIEKQTINKIIIHRCNHLQCRQSEDVDWSELATSSDCDSLGLMVHFMELRVWTVGWSVVRSYQPRGEGHLSVNLGLLKSCDFCSPQESWLLDCHPGYIFPLLTIWQLGAQEICCCSLLFGHSSVRRQHSARCCRIHWQTPLYSPDVDLQASRGFLAAGIQYC